MNTRTFTVTLEDMTQYSVTAGYAVSFEYDTFGCSLVIHAVKPITKTDHALTENRMSEIESAVAYLIVDEHEDFVSYRERETELC